MAQLKCVEAFQRQKYRVQWEKYFKKYLAYKKPYLINSQCFENIDVDEEIVNDQPLDKLEMTIIDSDDSDA